MTRNEFFDLVDEIGVAAALEKCGHEPEYVRVTPIGDGLAAEEWRCAKCGGSWEFSFPNGTREEECRLVFLHGGEPYLGCR